MEEFIFSPRFAYSLFLSISQMDNYNDIISLYQASNKILRQLFHTNPIYINTYTPLAMAILMKNSYGKFVRVRPHECLQEFYISRTDRRFGTIRCPTYDPIISLFISTKKLHPMRAILGASLKSSLIIKKDRESKFIVKLIGPARPPPAFLSIIISIDRSIKFVKTPRIIPLLNMGKCQTKFYLYPFILEELNNAMYDIIYLNCKIICDVIDYTRILTKASKDKVLLLVARVSVLIRAILPHVELIIPNEHSEKISKFMSEYSSNIKQDHPTPSSMAPVTPPEESVSLLSLERRVEKLRLKLIKNNIIN